jgi:hypothetical protein
LIDLALTELHRYIPASVNAKLEKSVVVRHEAIWLKPEALPKRPRQATPLPNFFLAGDYTRQSWYITMEGAAQSGEKAAASLLYRLGYRRRTSDVFQEVAGGTGLNRLLTDWFDTGQKRPVVRPAAKVREIREVEEVENERPERFKTSA